MITNAFGIFVLLYIQGAIHCLNVILKTTNNSFQKEETTTSLTTRICHSMHRSMVMATVVAFSFSQARMAR